MAVQLQEYSHGFSHATGLWNLSIYVTFHGHSVTQHFSGKKPVPSKTVNIKNYPHLEEELDFITVRKDENPEVWYN